jgi:hypothetical protein
MIAVQFGIQFLNIGCSVLSSSMKELKITWYTIHDAGRHLGTSARDLLYELIGLASLQSDVAWVGTSLLLSSVHVTRRSIGTTISMWYLGNRLSKQRHESR